MKTNAFSALCLVLFVTAAAIGMVVAEDARVGSLSAADFKRANMEAAERLKALKPDPAALAEKDRALFQEIVNGGSLQAAMSALVPEKSISASVKQLGQGEADEQAVLTAKLKEIAAAKGTTVTPDMGDPARKSLLILNEKTGADFDKAYILTCAVKGHQELQATLEKVRAESKDATLKELAAITLPLIKLHLRVSLEMAQPYNDVVLTPSNPPSPAPDAKPVPMGKQ